MPFEYLEPDPPPDIPHEPAAETEGARSRQLALFDVSPAGRVGRLTLREVQLQISHLTGQIEILRHQLREHGADRLARLLREMIEERERELERWLLQERRWDDRIASLESAIVERDRHRERERELMRERDEARRAAVEAERRLEAADFAAQEAYRKAAAMERAAERAQAEELRLRRERELDSKIWLRERWRTANTPDAPKGSWFSRFVRG